jgi:hypothetical protein
MNADTRGQRLAYGALIAFTVAVGVVTFVLSFYGLRDYGIRVEHLPVRMAPLVPVGVDILSLCGVAGTYLLRNAPLRVRAYAWLVFGVAVSASVAGNITHASAQRLSAAGMVGAAAWPILLALAAHFVIVTRRALERGTQSSTHLEPSVAQVPEPSILSGPGYVTAAQPTPEPPTPAQVAQPEVAQEPPKPVTQPVRSEPARNPPARARRPAASPSPELRNEVRSAYATGEGIGSIMKRLNGSCPSRRTLEGWTSDLREVHAQARAAAQAELTSAIGDAR